VQYFDVVVSGGGLVGASIVRAMSGSTLKILVLDQQPAHTMYSSALDNRGLALSYSSMKILSELNMWSLLQAEAYPIKTVHVSEQGSFGFTKLRADNFKVPALGYVVSASSIGAALITNLENLANVTVMRPATINDLSYNIADSAWTLDIQGAKITAKLLIAADGANSFLRARQNIYAVVKEHKQTALVTNLGLQQSKLETAFERFTAHGVLAILPFGENRAKCVWTLDNHLAANLKALNDVEFLAAAQAAFGFRIGRFTSVMERKFFPIQTVQASRIYGEGLVLLGNAANTLHPVAAQGFNLGLRDVVALAKNLTAGNYCLKDYAAQRVKDHQRAQNYTNSLVELFSSDVELVKISRRLGLLAAQFIPALNKHITASGMGVWTS